MTIKYYEVTIGSQSKEQLEDVLALIDGKRYTLPVFKGIDIEQIQKCGLCFNGRHVHE